MLHIDTDKFIVFFNRKIIIKFIKYYLIFLVVFLMVEVSTVQSIYKGTMIDYIKKLSTIVSREGEDLSLMCSIVSCESISDGGVNYILGEDGYLLQTTIAPDEPIFLGTFTSELKTVLNYNNHVIIVNDKRYIDTFLHILYINSFIFFLFYTYIFLKQLYIENINSTIEKTSYKIALENKLQRDITESAHHEMGMPLALIKTLVYDLYATTYPCPVSMSGICNMCTSEDDVDVAKCKECLLHTIDAEKDEIAKNYFMKMKFAIERLEAPLNQMAASKHIKYSNGNTAVYTIIDNIIKTNNSYKVNKIAVIYNNTDILKSYAVGYGMSNGDLLNILHAHTTNSIEAKATVITVGAELTSDRHKLDIYFSDNGRGIRDRAGNIVKTDDIFSYGYSTKTMQGDNINNRTILLKILVKIGILKDSIVPRGAGLSFTKGIALNSGGDVKLVSTSKDGTVFKITIPTKPRRDD